MKRLGMMLSLVAATVVTAADYEFTPVAGYVVKEGNLNLDNEWLVGGEFQFNTLFDSAIKPEVLLLFAPNTDYEDNVNETDIIRLGLNGVYEFATSGVVPFAKAGIGYEYMDTRLYENDSDLYVDAGAGVKVPLTDAMSLKAEALYMLKDLGDRRDSNLALLVGISFPFDSAAQPTVVKEEPVKAAEPVPVPKPAPAPAPAPVDSDGDGVYDNADACANTPAGAPVDAKGCPLDSDRDGVIDLLDRCAGTPNGAPVDAKGCPLDSDRDGVIDLLDKCPGTPEGFKVDTEGCPLTMDLELTYETNSAKIDAASMPKVQAFGKFLLENPGYSVHIVGHTDDRGAAAYNQKLSEKRAQSVRDALVEQGVGSARITSEGKGEAEPKADNATAEGRLANRRIEVQLHR